MPTYEYQCKKCAHEMEAVQRITEDELTRCPKCKKDSLTRLISATSFQLKGTGWYATDFKDKPKTKPASSETSGEKKSEVKTEKKSEVKAESVTKTETK
jgi:putative FmdB family regulatory protein